MNTQPPVIFTDNTPMPFGKYRGKPLVSIPAAYFIWLLESGCDHVALRNYINENIDCLRLELKGKR